jgi:hypothetical protein
MLPRPMESNPRNKVSAHVTNLGSMGPVHSHTPMAHTQHEHTSLSAGTAEEQFSPERPKIMQIQTRSNFSPTGELAQIA